MRKYLELFKDGFDATIAEKIKPENWPYVGYSPSEGLAFTVIPEPDTTNYFYIESLEDNNVITLDSTTWAGYGDNKSKLEYSNDATSWTSMNGVDSVTINNGKRLYMRCVEGNICKDLFSVPEEESEIILMTPLFKTSTNCNIGGNINTVMFDYTYKIEDCVLPAGAFAGLFTGVDMATGESANYIIDASKFELPATTLADMCYLSMFRSCTFLTTAPELPATKLANHCYTGMFAGCTSLVTAPKILPATTLVEGCYRSMFQDCTSLVTAPVLPATTLVEGCYWSMFMGCTSLATAPELPATELAAGCYYSMFSGCTSLTTAPELPATTLTDMCYDSMFNGCTNLNYIKCLAPDISAFNCTSNWVYGVSSAGTFIKHPNMNFWTTGTNGIPSGWDVEDAVI